MSDFTNMVFIAGTVRSMGVSADDSVFVAVDVSNDPSVLEWINCYVWGNEELAQRLAGYQPGAPIKLVGCLKWKHVLQQYPRIFVTEIRSADPPAGVKPHENAARN